MGNERPSSLEKHLMFFKDEGFDWETNNCMSFVSDYLESLGQDPLPLKYIIGNKSEREAYKSVLRYLKDHDYNNLVDAFSDRFERVMTLHPEDGLIVAEETDFGLMFGLTYSGFCFFLDESGLKGYEPKMLNKYWSVG